MSPAPTAARPLRLELTASPGLAAGIAVAHLAAAGGFLTVLTGWPGPSLAVLVVLLGGVTALDRALLRFAGSPRAIEIHADGTGKCLFANGESAVMERARGAVIARYWVALRMRARYRRSLLVAAGMLPPPELRLLRLWALWGRLPARAPLPAVEERV